MQHATLAVPPRHLDEARGLVESDGYEVATRSAAEIEDAARTGLEVGQQCLVF